MLEAMSVGVPCACSDTSALNEIAEDCALLFDPNSPEEIKISIEKLLTDKQLVDELVAKGSVQCRRFDWKKHVENLCKACDDLYHKYSVLDIFDIDFQNRRVGEMLDIFNEHLKLRQKKTIAFINTHYLNTAYENPDQLQRLKSFDYVLPDGSGVSLACKILGFPYRDNLNGTDLTLNLCELSEKYGYKMYFFGGKEGVASRAVENLKKRFPKISVVGIRSGYFAKSNEQKIIDEINESKADILFVGFGAPLQEKWVLENKDKLDTPLVFAIGGMVDVYSGDLSRNGFLRKFGLEWLGRLFQDPIRLFPRYVIGNPLFVFRVIKYKFARKRAKR